MGRNAISQKGAKGLLCLLSFLALGSLAFPDIRQSAFIRLSMLFQYHEIQSPEDLVDLHLRQVYSFLPLAPPSRDVFVHPGAPRTIPFQLETFSKPFQDQLIGTWNDSQTAPGYAVWMQIKHWQLLVYNANGVIIAQYALPKAYDEDWLVDQRYPDGFPASIPEPTRRELLGSMHPSRMMTEVTLVPSKYLYAWLLDEEGNAARQQSLVAVPLSGSGGSQMAMSSTEEIAIDGISFLTNLSISSIEKRSSRNTLFARGWRAKLAEPPTWKHPLSQRHSGPTRMKDPNETKLRNMYLNRVISVPILVPQRQLVTEVATFV